MTYKVNQNTRTLAGMFIVIGCLLAGTIQNASAASLTGSNVTITSSFDGGNPQSTTVTVGTPDTPGASKEVTSPTFSWMSANDYIDFSFDGTLNVLDVVFSSADVFQPTDDISITVDLSPSTFGVAALTKAIDLQVPTANISGSILTFDMTNLDQIAGNGGQAEYVFDAVAPEPATFGFIGLGIGGMLLLRKRRTAQPGK